MVDAQVYMFGVLGHIVAVAEQLDAGHVHRHHKTGREAAVKHRDGQERIHGRNGIAAQNRSGLAQLLQRQTQRRTRADGVTVRVLMA